MTEQYPEQPTQLEPRHDRHDTAHPHDSHKSAEHHVGAFGVVVVQKQGATEIRFQPWSAGHPDDPTPELPGAEPRLVLPPHSDGPEAGDSA